MNVEELAFICHELNRAYCRATGDYSQPEWHDAEGWQRDSAINGVRAHIADPDLSESASHDLWWAEKRDAGWVYGETKNPEKKTHPCCVPYEDLPLEQRLKDRLFKQTVHALAELVTDTKPVA